MADRGTLSQLKNDFGHRNVSTDIMNCFNFADNFLRFITEAYVVYLALVLCDMDDVEAVPSQVDTFQSHDQLMAFFNDLCERIVRHIWLMPSVSEVTAICDCDVNNSFITDDWCICGEGMQKVTDVEVDEIHYYSISAMLVCGLLDIKSAVILFTFVYAQGQRLIGVKIYKMVQGGGQKLYFLNNWSLAYCRRFVS